VPSLPSRLPGIWALPLAPLATTEESKVEPIGLEQLLVVQTWKVMVPVSLASGSLKVALSHVPKEACGRSANERGWSGRVVRCCW
jgi:hypothetical protein